jgi:hypothetical protein
MSIWCSLPAIGFAAELDEPVGQVRSYASGWSNHYPTTDGAVEREAALDLAYIPAWCAGGADDDFEVVGPWFRLGLYSHTHNYSSPADVVGPADATVVLDEDAVRALIGELTVWLNRPKVSPGRSEAHHD